MPSSLLQWIALFGFVAIGLLFLTELRRWRVLRTMIRRRQRILRTVLILLIEGLFVMMYVSPWVIGRGDVLAELVYWTVCLLVGLAVVALALLDLREVVRSYALECYRTFSEIDTQNRRDK